MKKLVNIVLVVIVVLAVAGMAARDLDIETLLDNTNISEKNNFSPTKVAEDMNKNLPSMINDITRLDEVTVSDQTLIYNFTLVGFSKEEIAPEALVPEIKPKTLTNYCSSPQMAEIKNNNITLEARYVDESRQFITGFTVSSSECKS